MSVNIIKKRNKRLCNCFGSADGMVGICIDYSIENKELWRECMDYKNSKINGKLRPLHGSIIATYTTKANPQWGSTKGFFNTYEDFGEWLCRSFSKIELLDISAE